MGAPAAPNPAQTPAIVILVCALAVLVGTFTKSWMSADQAAGEYRPAIEIGIGLTGMSAMGVSVSWGDMDSMADRRSEWDDEDEGSKKVPIQIKLFGYLGFLGGLAAAGVAAAAGIMGLTRSLRKVKMNPFLGIIAGAAAAQAIFLVSILTTDYFKQGEMADGGMSFGISWSGIVAIAGLIGAAVVLKTMLGPHIAHAIATAPPPAAPMGYGQPGMPMMGQPPMQAAPQPPMQAAPQQGTVTCPRCQGQATFVAQYNRHFCNACQQYV